MTISTNTMGDDSLLVNTNGVGRTARRRCWTCKCWSTGLLYLIPGPISANLLPDQKVGCDRAFPNATSA
jgi:hypothetical protein